MAQDIHFSQFYYNPLYLNPALTGVFSGDQRFSGSYRSQWADVPVPYTTLSGAYDEKVYMKGVGAGLWAWGISFTRDEAGDGALSWTFLEGSAAYVQRLTKDWYLSAGLGLAMGQRAFEADQLRFGDQFNGEVFDPDLHTAESFERTAAAFASVSSGLNLYYQSSAGRSFGFLGAGVHQLNRPGLSFIDIEKVMLYRRWTFSTRALIQIDGIWDAEAAILYQAQGPYSEILFSGQAKLHLDLSVVRPLAVALGLGFRLQDAMIGQLAVHYQHWVFGFSYDFNTSPFRVATMQRGGPEFSVRHIISRVKPPEEFKSCPIF